MSAGPRKSLMFNLGRFVGHIVHGLKTDVPARGTRKHEVRREVEEASTPDGSVTLRRTIIEEVEVHPRGENP